LIASVNQNRAGTDNRAKKYVEKRVKKCLSKYSKFDAGDTERSLNELFSLRNDALLYKYLSAEVLVKNFDKLRKEFPDFNEISLDVALSDLVDQEQIGYKYLDLGDTCDFVQRDALYFGSVKLDIAPKHLYSQLPRYRFLNEGKKKLIDEDFDEGKLIKTNQDYLAERFYNDPGVVWFSSIYSKILASLISSKNFNFTWLEEYNDEQFKKLIIHNSDKENKRAKLPAKWITLAHRLFNNDIRLDLVFELKNVGMLRASTIDVECDLVSKKPTELGYLSYPFKRGVLVSVACEASRPMLWGYKPFSVRLFQDRKSRCLVALLLVAKQLSFHLSINQTSKLRASLGNQISWTHQVRFDDNETVRAIAKAIQSIEERSNGAQDKFVTRLANSLISMKTFRGIWSDYDNFSLFPEWRRLGVGLGVVGESRSTEYEDFAAGLLSLPAKLLQFKSTAEFLDKIYTELLELIRREDATDVKGLYFEALCYLHVIRQQRGQFQLFLNDMVVVDPTKPPEKQDNNEFDIVEFLLNDEKKAECHVYACSIADDCEQKNEEPLERIVTFIRKRFEDAVVRSWYVKPAGKQAGDFTPSAEETGRQYLEPSKKDC